MKQDDYPEGATPLDPDEMAGIKPKHITARAEFDELEQANIQQGLAWLKRSRENDILTDHFMRTLHKKLFGDIWDWAGAYRHTGKNIGIDPQQIVVQHRVMLDTAQFWAEDKTFEPLEAAARFHHRMVFIHPYPNGNGRHARIAADVYLEKSFGHPPIEWADGFDLQIDSERRKAYLAALQTADRGDFQPLFKFVGLNQAMQ